jgi:8-oxo-dGTP diphosphatase
MTRSRVLRVAELIRADSDALEVALRTLPVRLSVIVAELPIGVLLTLELRRPWWDRRPRTVVVRGLQRLLESVRERSERVLVVGAVIRRGNEVLVGRRTHPARMAGYWEFPGGKVELGESPGSALRRECYEELGVRVDIGDELGRLELDSGAVLSVSWATLSEDSLPPQALEHSELRWCGAAALAELDWLATNRGFAAEVAEQLR